MDRRRGNYEGQLPFRWGLIYTAYKVMHISTENAAHFPAALSLFPIKIHTDHRALTYHSLPQSHWHPSTFLLQSSWDRLQTVTASFTPLRPLDCLTLLLVMSLSPSHICSFGDYLLWTHDAITVALWVSNQ